MTQCHNFSIKHDECETHAYDRNYDRTDGISWWWPIIMDFDNPINILYNFDKCREWLCIFVYAIVQNGTR